MLKKEFIWIFVGIFIIAMLSSISPYTAPTFNDINFTLCSGYTAPTFNDINFTLGLDDSCEAPPVDSCTPPAINNNWNISLQDFCIINDDIDLGTGTLFFSLTGNATLNATIDTTDFGPIPSNGIVYLDTNGRINVA